MNLAQIIETFANINTIYFLGISFVIILILREISCWYFKLNKISDLLEKIEENTKKPIVDNEVKK